MKTLKLPPNETFTDRYVDWTICNNGDVRGIMEIREKTTRKSKREKVSRYLVKEYARRIYGRGFQLTKPGGGEQYNVEIVVTMMDLCDCTGFLQYGRCKHTTALRELVRAGLVLDRPTDATTDGPQTADVLPVQVNGRPVEMAR